MMAGIALEEKKQTLLIPFPSSRLSQVGEESVSHAP